MLIFKLLLNFHFLLQFLQTSLFLFNQFQLLFRVHVFLNELAVKENYYTSYVVYVLRIILPELGRPAHNSIGCCLSLAHFVMRLSDLGHIFYFHLVPDPI